MNAAALETQSRSIGRKTKTDSSFNAAALKTQCYNIGKKAKTRKLAEWWMLQHEYLMSQHAWFVEKLKIQCCNIEQWMPQHWSLKLKKNKEFDFY